ncbi:MAG: F0F1 ATP synthase subunit delta [Verrucomicrobia bacterium]|nr:F0F1 ATP synthase subunit delta [Verrucomicrobiota bacterium]
MQASKDVRQMARELLRASFTDGQLDHGRVSSVVNSVLQDKPRNYLRVLEYYKRLLRLELEKRHARIETAAPLEGQAAAEIKENLTRRYGTDLSTEFVVNPALLGGMRVRVGSDVWDSSVRNRLERLEHQL